MPAFIGERITVAADGSVGQPVTFRWGGREYRVSEVLLSWFDWGFPAGSAQRNWKTRRHRTYYRIRTHTGEVFEIYRDRTAAHGAGIWYLYQRLSE